MNLYVKIFILILVLAIVGGIVYALTPKGGGGDQRPIYDPLVLFGPSYPKDLDFSNVGTAKLSNGKYQVFFSIKTGRGSRWLNPYIVLYNPKLGIDASTFDTEDAVRAFVATNYDPANVNKAFAAASSLSVEEAFRNETIEYIFDVRGGRFASA